MTQKHTPTFIAWRFYLTLLVITLAAGGLAYRVIDLSIFDQHFLRQQSDERVLRLVSVPALRGMIVDRNHFPLAVSTTVYSAWINPQVFAPTRKELATLNQLLNIKGKQITTLIQRYQKKNKEFVYLKRALPPEVAQQIKDLNLPGLHLQQEYKRYYPEGEAVAQVVGFTNIDDQGQEGLELGYNDWLSGEPGKKWVIKDRIGRVISDVQTVSHQEAGRDLVLSIDRRIQYLAYRELLKGIQANTAHSGSVVVLDIQTGEVLAMVNYPSFNPNSRSIDRRDSIRNRAVTDIFEPGSTIKAFTVASGLESGRFHPNSVIDTSPGWMRVGHNVVKDEKNNGLLTLAKILQISSNMGAAKMVLDLPDNQLWSLLHRVGFGEGTGINFPGEQNGSLTKHEPWGNFVLATLSFGYGMSSTALQLARAYSVLGHHGIKMPISLLKVDNASPGERVLEAKVARDMLSLLEAVINGGTGKAASVPGYRVAGKTGTSKMVGETGYLKHRYISSFVGVAPLTEPRLVVAVVIHDPQGKQFYGGDVSGPVFEKIMEGTLRLLGVPPDAAPVA